MRGKKPKKPGGGVVGFVEGEDVEGGESGAVQTHVVADGVGFQAVVAHERAITEMKILEMSEKGENGDTVTRTLAALRAEGIWRMVGCRLRLSSPIKAERSCSMVSCENSLETIEHAKERTSSLLV